MWKVHIMWAMLEACYVRFVLLYPLPQINTARQKAWGYQSTVIFMKENLALKLLHIEVNIFTIGLG